MIDIHTHILPNIDDGSKSIEETFNLIKEAKSVGFDSIVLTSHYMEGYYETNSPEREVWLDAIRENLEAKNIDIKLYLGNEIYMSENIIKLLEEGKATTMNNTSYVLFEMPLNAEPLNLYDIIYEMQQYKIVPILAHPERYSFVQQDPELIYDLIQKGVLMQANYGSIIGQYGEKAQVIVKKFFENNMIHMLGSDVHRQNTIYPKIPDILMELNELIGEEKLKEFSYLGEDIAKEVVIKNPQEIAASVDILKPMRALNYLQELVLYHHEKYDGTGYPSGLKGSEIPYLARILTVVDSFDAMTSNRPYNRRKSYEEAIKELRRCSGTQFDPDIAESFIEVIKENKDNLGNLA